MSGKEAERASREADTRRRRAGLSTILPWLIIAVSVLVAAGVAGTVVLSRTTAGRELALDWALERLRPAINGSVRVGSVGPGGLLAGATLHDVEFSDSLGRPVLVVDSIRAQYSIVELLRGRPGIADLHLWSPVLSLEPVPGERVDLARLLRRPAAGPDADSTALHEPISPAFRIRRARIHAGTVVMRDGDGAEKRVEHIAADLPRIDVRPNRDVFLAGTVDDVTLSYPAGDGRIGLSEIRGALEVGSAGITVDAEQFRFPASEGRGRLLAAPGQDGWHITFDLDFSRLSLTDLDWLDDRLAYGAARGGLVIGISPDGLLIDVTAGHVEGRTGRVALSGGLSLGDTARFRGLRIAPEMLATAEVERWVTGDLPVAGALTGDIRLDGVPGRLAVAGDLALADVSAPDTLVRIAGEGTVLGRRALEAVALELTSLDYELLGALVPEIPWSGRGEVSLRANGDLRTGMEVRVAARQSLAGGPVSSVVVAGRLYGDTAVSLVDLDASLNPLSLSMLGKLYPELPLTGEVDGSVSLNGTLDELGFVAELRTPAGGVAANGVFNVRDPAAGYRIAASGRDFRVSELVDGLPDPLILSGSARLSGSGWDLASGRGSLDFDAGPSRIGSLRVDSAAANLLIDDNGLLHVESLYANAGGVVVRSRGGSVGAAPGVLGEGVVLSVSSGSIRPLRDLFMGENLVAWDELAAIEQDAMIEFDGVDPDTFPTAREIRFDGRVDGEVRLAGGLGGLSAEAAIGIGGFEFGVNEARSLAFDVTARGFSLLRAGSTAFSPSPMLDGTVTGDSIWFGGREFQSARVTGGDFDPSAGGRLHVLVVRKGGAALAESESYEAQGVVRLNEGRGRVDLDRLNLVFDDRRWGLRGPASFEWSPDVLVVNDFGLIRPGVEGLRALADGRLALGDGESDFELSVAELDLEVVGRLLQLAEFPVGVASAGVHVTGSGTDPEWEGFVRLEDTGHGTLRFDSVIVLGTYANRTLDADAESWSRGHRTIQLKGAVPLDLRLAAVEDRVPDEPLDLDIVADSFPAAMVLGVLNSLEEVGGTLTGDVRVRGRPSDLEPDGVLRLADATGLLAPLGVRLSSVEIDMVLSPDGTVAVDGSGVSGGTIEVRGTVGAENLTDPVLDLAFWPRDFQIVDRRDMEAAVSGDSITLTGSFSFPYIEGQLDVNGGTVFVEEFQRTAEAIDFYDPVLFSAATVEIGTGDEGDDPGVRERNPFLQNLRVLIDMNVARGNWLRSRIMNVETAGDLRLTFDRQGNQLILQGDIEVVRGTYSVGPRTLTMTDGTFQFVGTPGFDPGLAVTAENRLRTREGEPLVITANISGTLLSPRIDLASDATLAISEADLVNYLILGRPTSALISEGGAASVGAGTNLLFSQFANELGYLLALGLDVDQLSVSQSEQGQANAAFGASSLQVEMGLYVMDDVFVSGVWQRGFCADPTLPVNSGGVRVDVDLPRDVKFEGFLEGRCTRDRYRGLGDPSLELARIWGFSFFREWGY